MRIFTISVSFGLVIVKNFCLNNGMLAAFVR